MSHGPARRRRSGAIDRLQALQVRLSHHRQGACCEFLISGYRYVCYVCVQCRIFNKSNRKKKLKNRNRFAIDRCYHCHCHRIAITRSHDCMTGCARGSVTHALIRSHTGIRTYTEAICQHEQNRLPSGLWVLFLMLLVGMSPNSCSGGECANMHIPNLAQTRIPYKPSPII